MIIRLANISIAALILAAPAVFAAEGTYDYDHPELWQDMEGSECAGMKNSPIALTSSDCTAYGEYEMWVGNCMLYYLIGLYRNVSIPHNSIFCLMYHAVIKISWLQCILDNFRKATVLLPIWNSWSLTTE